jgi:hypothetical protein
VRDKTTTVPSTCLQPEKALYFMNWLMTDPDASDILTFGSNMMNLKHYRFSDDGTIIPEKDNLIYGYYSLVAGFTSKVFLCGNEQFDISKIYREKTYYAEIPPFYKKLADQHTYINYLQNFYVSNEYDIKKRHQSIVKIPDDLINNPQSSLSPKRNDKKNRGIRNRNIRGLI